MELRHEELWPLVHERLRTYMGSTWDVGRVAAATGSIPATVTGWLADSEPTGERLIRLWHFLAASGLASPEIDRLGKFNRYCGELLAFGIVDMDELCQICGVQNQNAVLRALRGSPPARPAFNYEQLQEMYDAKLHAAKRKVPVISMSPPPHKAAAPAEKRQTPTAPPTGDSLVLQAAATLSAALPFARHFNSDTVSPEDRSKLRGLMGEDGMFELSTHLNALCSERSRNQGRTAQ